MTGVIALPLRIKLWLGSVLLCLGIYGVRSTHFPRRTAAGVEHRLFGGIGCSVVPEPGRQGWLIGAPDPPTIASNVAEGLLWRVSWPGRYESARQLTPFLVGGTWALQPLGLRHVWSRRATEVTQNRYLWTASPAWAALLADSALPQVFNYRRGREIRGEEALRLLRSQSLQMDHQLELEMLFSEVKSELSEEAAGLEGIDSELRFSLALTGGDRGVKLWWGAEEGGGLYAISEEPTPKVLRITAGATPRAISADGRTLFFERDGALWRMDLRRPLPELLDEATPPALPDAPF
jgi:hypothetical protein